MVRKRKPGGGRKPRGEGPAVAFNTRIEPETRRLLERAAKENGRSLSAEIARRLKNSFGPAAASDIQTRALCHLLDRIVTMARGLKRTGGEPFNWRTNRFDYLAFKYAVEELLHLLAPADEDKDVGPCRYMVFQNPPVPNIAPSETNRLLAANMGAALASGVYAFLTTPDDLWRAIAELQQAGVGDPPYAFPQAADALGVLREHYKRRTTENIEVEQKPFNPDGEGEDR